MQVAHGLKMVSYQVVIEGCDRDGYARVLRQHYQWLPEGLALRFARTYGSNSVNP